MNTRSDIAAAALLLLLRRPANVLEGVDSFVATYQTPSGRIRAGEVDAGRSAGKWRKTLK